MRQLNWIHLSQLTIYLTRWEGNAYGNKHTCVEEKVWHDPKLKTFTSKLLRIYNIGVFLHLFYVFLFILSSKIHYRFLDQYAGICGKVYLASAILLEIVLSCPVASSRSNHPPKKAELPKIQDSMILSQIV